MKLRLEFFGIAGIILIGCLFLFSGMKVDGIGQFNKLKINGKTISLIVVDTPAGRAHGLSDRESLPENSAMLFVFQDPDKYGFWMKDMKFPIDMIWLDPAFKVVYIAQNVSPNTYPQVFTPPEKSLYVLETNANFAYENDIKVGSVLDFKNF
jgi:uncharacterized protein